MSDVEKELDEHGCVIGEEEWDSELEKCLPLPEAAEQEEEEPCPEGQHRDPETGKCVPNQPVNVEEFTFQEWPQAMEGFAFLAETAHWINKFNTAMRATKITPCPSNPGKVHVSRKRLKEMVKSLNKAIGYNAATWVRCNDILEAFMFQHKLIHDQTKLIGECMQLNSKMRKQLDVTMGENMAVRETVCALEEHLMPKRARLREMLASGKLSLEERVENLKLKIPPRFKAPQRSPEQSNQDDDEVVTEPYKQ